ncbi:hypothetical protein EDB89DRAFT_1910237 [Lactarius sanguifluus]|nr:hypothetical protein EDB89DRAFT_1910237 [Lactarius sanguifluus]
MAVEWGRGGECGARLCCWPWQSRGLAVLVAMGLVDVAPGLVGVVPGLVGVTSRLVGVAPGLVSVAPGIVIVEPGWSWHGIVGMAWARVAVVGPGSRRGICSVGVTVQHDGEMAWLGWR